MTTTATVCPTCQPDNPATRFRDTCVVHRVEGELPAHYFDCDRFRTYDHGTSRYDCDCTASADIRLLLDLVRDLSQTSASVDVVPNPSLSAPSAQKGTPDLTASTPDLAVDVVGTTGPSS